MSSSTVRYDAVRCGAVRCSALNARLGIRCLQSPSLLPPSGLVLSEVRLENGVCKNEPHRKHTEVRRERIELCISDHWCWWCAMCDWSCPGAVSLVAHALSLALALARARARALSAVRHVVRFMLRVAHPRQSCLFGHAPATPSYWLLIMPFSRLCPPLPRRAGLPKRAGGCSGWLITVKHGEEGNADSATCWFLFFLFFFLSFLCYLEYNIGLE